MDLYYKYQLLAKEKAIELKIEMTEGLPLVFADIALVERVIQNLVDNALKFTPDGGTITLMLKHSANNVEVTVKDTGPGIAEQDQTYIFERYRKAKATSKGNFGAGLGLAIVKKILDIHNSSIKVISRPDQGSAFQFALPVYTN